jgi:hypothetical protein
MAQIVVLLEEHRRRPLPIFSGHLIAAVMGIGPRRQGEEEAGQPHQGHRASEAPWPPRYRCHQGIPRDDGATNGACAPATPDDARCIA